MRWRVLLEVTGTDGVTVTHEVTAGARQAPDAAAATIGLTLAEGKSTLAILQHHLIRIQAAAHCEERRLCERCGARRPVKDRRSRKLLTLFGAVEVDALRFAPCRCGVAPRRTISPLAELMPDRCTREYECVLARMSALLPYGRADALVIGSLVFSEFTPRALSAPALSSLRD